MSGKKRFWLHDYEAELLDLPIKPNYKGRDQAQYSLNKEKESELLFNRANRVKNNSTSVTQGYKEKFVLSAWDSCNSKMMNIDEYCSKYNLPRKDITSYKLVSHTGTPFYNVVFKENVEEQKIDFDIEPLIKKHIKPVKVLKQPKKTNKDFDVLTYTDVHIGMNTNPENKSMYSEVWNAEKAIKLANVMAQKTIESRESSILIVDDLGDFLDGMNGQTTRGGHSLPQNMTNEECYDTGLSFKMVLADLLAPYYSKIIFNNICNDNHAGSFGYFVNKAFKEVCNVKYKNIEVNNCKQFINHYFVNKVCFVITHGKDDRNLKFGFKPILDTKQAEKIDQYLKQNNIYKDAELIIFKKGDSHQALFDFCTSDDFYYFNYPAASPSSDWVQTNFKKGRKGFVNESFVGTEISQNIKFL